MRVMVATEHRFYRTPNGKVYSATHGRQYSFWERYLSVFDEVLVVARVKLVKMIPKFLKRADGTAVKFYPLPDFTGLTGILKTLPRLWKCMQQIAKEKEAFILRVPGAIGTLLYWVVKKEGKPFAVEVVGDPWGVFAPGSYHSIARTLIRWLSAHCLKAQCKEAVAAAYVTKDALQRRYPPGGWSTYYSSVDLPSEAFISDKALAERLAKLIEKGSLNSPKCLISVGTLAQLYKGQDVFLKAFARCIREGLDLELLMIGDGAYREYLENLANKLGIKAEVKFLGQLPREVVLQQLREADLFVLPSKTEGLPRAMIEAMACGLPCIGSTVGGIPELLPSEDLVPPDDIEALAQKIEEVVRDPARMRQMAERNLRTAQDYRPEVLQVRREQFYKKVRELTEKWYTEKDRNVFYMKKKNQGITLCIKSGKK